MNPSPLILNADILRQIAERSLSVFFHYTLHPGRFAYVSPAFEEVWGREEGSINEDLPQLLSTVHPGDLPLLEAGFQKLLTDNLRQLLEFRIRAENGQEKWIYLTAYAIVRDGQRQAIVGFAEDISHHKENEVLLNKFASHKNGIIEMLAHDLNGPLGIVRNLARQLVQKAQEAGRPDLGDEAALIVKTAGHSIHMLHDYLEKEYLESVEAGLKFQRVELIEQITFMLQGFERMDQDHHKHFEMESSAPQVFAEVDQVKFLQVLSNLVSNAVKFTPVNGHIRINVQEEPGNLLISVSDDGIGIPKELQPLLFDRFTKARRPGLQGEETTGLGLSIVRRIVELHRGTVWVESEENKGATFYVRIPRQA